MSWTYDMAGVLTEIRAETQSTNFFTWKESDIPCTASFARRGQRIDIGGYEITVAVTLTVILSEFITSDNDVITSDYIVYLSDNNLLVPSIGKVVTYKGKEYRIATTELSPSFTFANLLCEDVNK